MAEEVFSWVTEIPPARAQDVKDVLNGLDGMDAASDLPLVSLPMLHFANAVVFTEPDATDVLAGATVTHATLVFEHNIDGPYADYEQVFVGRCRRGLDRIFAWCDRYPHGGADEDVARYLRQLKRTPTLFHLGHPNRSVDTIRGDFELRRSIGEELAKNPALRDQSPAEVVRTLRRIANCPTGLKWFWRRTGPPPRGLRAVGCPWRPWHESWQQPPDRKAPPTPLNRISWIPGVPSRSRARRLLQVTIAAWWLGIAAIVLTQKFVPREVTLVVEFALVYLTVHFTSLTARIVRGLIAGAILASVVALSFRWIAVLSAPTTLVYVLAAIGLIPFVLLFIAYLNTLRQLQPTAPMPALAPRAVRELVEVEDADVHGIYNHVAGLSAFVPDHLWWRRLRTWAALFFLNVFYRTQFVKGRLVTIPSIHFASWTLVDKRHLLFVTNYEGSADRYLDDFFESLAQGVAFIWHDTVKFPRTGDPRRLKVWVRDSQTLASLRYRAPAYDDLTVAAINNNTFIRKRLLRGRSQRNARRFLYRFTTTLPEDLKWRDALDRWLRRVVSTS